MTSVGCVRCQVVTTQHWRHCTRHVRRQGNRQRPPATHVTYLCSPWSVSVLFWSAQSSPICIPQHAVILFVSHLGYFGLLKLLHKTDCTADTVRRITKGWRVVTGLKNIVGVFCPKAGSFWRICGVFFRGVSMSIKVRLLEILALTHLLSFAHCINMFNK